MYRAYRQIVYDGADSTRTLDDRVTRSLATGTHTVTITDVDVGVEFVRLRLANQFGEAHIEPVLIRDSDSTISWNLWRLLSAIMAGRDAVYRARRHILAQPSLLYQLAGVQTRIHLVHGPGYTVTRTATGRYCVVIMPDNFERPERYGSYEEATLAAEQLGHEPSTYRVGGWKPAGTTTFVFDKEST